MAAWSAIALAAGEVAVGIDGLPAPDAVVAAPSAPGDWAEQDRGLRGELVLHAQPGHAFAAAQPCACGGVWRYVLAGSERRPIWRCLHCGALRAGGG